MLSKYQEKTKARYCETESGRIAYTIVEHRNEIESSNGFSIKIGEGIEINDEGHLALVIFKPVLYKPNRFLYKIIPRFEDHIDNIIEMLDAQSWRCF